MKGSEPEVPTGGDIPRRRVAVVGENVADAIVESADGSEDSVTLRVVAGGGPANTALALARLGTPVSFLGRFPKGVLGGLFRDRLSRSGVDLSSSVVGTEPATLAITSIDEAGQANYEFYVTGTADWQWTPAELLPARVQSATCVHTGSLSLAMEPGGTQIEQLLRAARAHATISIDPNVRTAVVGNDVYRSKLPTWAALTDVIRLSDEDMAQLAPGESWIRTAAGWHEAGVRLVVLTLAGKGAVASLDGSTIAVPAVPVRVRDTIGAGDAFSAGLLHWLAQAGLLGGRLQDLTGDALKRALMFGAHVSALTCSVAGATPPWHDQLTADARALLPGQDEAGLQA